MYIYKWPAEKENDTGVVQQVAVCEVEGPGISGYASEVGKAGPSLKHCMDEAKEIVPQTKHHETPVYLGATAGMRLLSIEDADTAKNVLSGVEETLRSYPFRFQGARILSGEEEGAYGWITLNYLLGNFKESIWPSFLPRIFFRTGTTGALDLGGASTQITFVPDQKKIESSEYMVNFYLYGKNYTVYTHSFLCYGKDQALRLKMLNDVLHSSTGTVQDPCFQQGYERTVNIADLRTNPCTASSFKAPLYSTLHIVGTGNYEMCLKSIENIFNIVGCPYSSCSFNGTFLPQVSGEFGLLDVAGMGTGLKPPPGPGEVPQDCWKEKEAKESLHIAVVVREMVASQQHLTTPYGILQDNIGLGAFSAFYYVMNFLNVTEESMDKVIEALKTFCSKSWVKVKADFPKIKEKYLSEYCFAGTYIISLLNQRYRFTEKKWKDIRFLGKIGESDAGWTLGYMLNLTNMIPAEQPYIRPLSHANYISLMVVCSIMVVSLLFIAYMIYRKPKCLKKEII
ncbi:hypothetical protein JD844_007022 [Phrynosoma platyrhinos]|uniref:Ectonucleoside triphosphate diphosphohydrolase 1 n=1 Tax=Phrynosoma platyrhinos TaxID=52577 RepID=A0ABQ7T2I3_PHRPL|nr:hypothetical protein JD844_007022 [Phrynosoma platyrhinos]